MLAGCIEASICQQYDLGTSGSPLLSLPESDEMLRASTTTYVDNGVNAQEDVDTFFHGQPQGKPCSLSSLKLPAAWAAKFPYSFPKTSCDVQVMPQPPNPSIPALLYNCSIPGMCATANSPGIVSWKESSPQSDVIPNILSWLVQAAVGFIKAPPAVPSKHDQLKADLFPGKQTQPLPSPLGTYGPAYAYDLVRNGTSGGPFNPDPQIPSVTQETGRKLAETSSFAATIPLQAKLQQATPLDAVVSTGSEVVYSGNNGTIDSTNFFLQFYFAVTNPAVTKFRLETGTYRVTNPNSNFNLLLTCQGVVRSAFELDFGGSTIIFQVGFCACMRMS